MAELLVYIKKHWMDKLPYNELKKRIKGPEFKRSYDNRYCKGNVIEVQPDDYWSKKHGYNKMVFGVVCLPGTPTEEVKYLVKPLKKEIMSDDGKIQIEVIKRRRYSLDVVNELELSPNKLLSFSKLPVDKIIDKLQPEVF